MIDISEAHDLRLAVIGLNMRPGPRFVLRIANGIVLDRSEYEFQCENGRVNRYPFSLRFIMNCIDRVVNRKEYDGSYSPPIETVLSGMILNLQKFRKV